MMGEIHGDQAKKAQLSDVYVCKQWQKMKAEYITPHLFSVSVVCMSAIEQMNAPQ
jgi:hypothetical protein